MDFWTKRIEESLKNMPEPKQLKPKKASVRIKKEAEPVVTMIADVTKREGRNILVYNSYQSFSLVWKAMKQIDNTAVINPYINTEQGYFIIDTDENISIDMLWDKFNEMGCVGTFINIQRFWSYTTTEMGTVVCKDESSHLFGRKIEIEKDYQMDRTTALATATRRNRKGDYSYRVLPIDGESGLLTFFEESKELTDKEERGIRIG